MHIKEEQVQEFKDFCGDYKKIEHPFYYWHSKDYLRCCMANLYEKHFLAKGRSRISDEDWNKLAARYKEVLKEDYTL